MGSHDRRSVGVAALILAVAGGVAFAPMLDLGFVDADAYPLIFASRFESLQELGTVLTESLMGGRWPHALFYRPLESLSFGLEYLVWGDDAFGYHLGDLVLHVGNALLLFLLCRRLLVLAADGQWTIRQDATALSIALLFLLHPVQTVQVPTTVGRGDAQAVMFLLLTLLTALARPSGRNLALGLLFTALSMAGKELGVLTAVLVVVVTLVRREFSRRPDEVFGLVRTVTACWPYFGVVLAFLGLRYALFGGLGGYYSAKEPLLFAFSTAVSGMVRGFISPWTVVDPGQYRATVFPWPHFVVVVAMCIGAGVHLRRSRRALALLAIPLVTLVLCVALLTATGLKLTPRRMYLATVALAALGGGLLAAVVSAAATSRGQRIARAALGLVCGVQTATVLACSVVLGPVLGLQPGLAPWRAASSMGSGAEALEHIGLGDLPEGTRLFFVNTPYCDGGGCGAWSGHIYMEHTLQAWLDRFYPQKAFDAVVINYLSYDGGPRSAAARYDATTSRIYVAVTGALTSKERWAQYNSHPHPRHRGQAHNDLYAAEVLERDSAAYTLAPSALSGPYAFVAFVGATPMRFPTTSWAAPEWHSPDTRER